MASVRFATLKALHGSLSLFNLSKYLLPRTQTFTVRAFSATMSPPSTAVVYEQQGPPDSVTRLVELPPVEIKENDVCVKMLAAPTNTSDINKIEGVYPVRPQVPAVAGYEGVREVHSLGSAVRGLSPGDWVIPCPPSFGDSIVQNGATSMVGQCIIQIARALGIQSINILRDRMELVPFNDFHTALDKSLGKLGSQHKQVIKF